MARVGGRYISLGLVLNKILARRRAVRATLVIAFEILGKVVKVLHGYGKLADSTTKELVVRLFAMFQRLSSEGKLVPHPTQRVKGRLEGIAGGLHLLKSGSLSGKKLSALLFNELTHEQLIFR